MDNNTIFKRDKNIIKRWNQKDRPSLRTVGKEFGISGERVRQILEINNIQKREKLLKLTKEEKKSAKLASRILKFWDNVDIKSADECWEWLGYTHPKLKYGLFRFSFIKETLTHRISWRITHNFEDPRPLHVLHKCDNPSCVNPSHLFLGTKSENAIDRTKKGRTNGARFNETDILIIRELYKTMSISEIANKYDYSYSTIQGVVKRKTWKWIK